MTISANGYSSASAVYPHSNVLFYPNRKFDLCNGKTWGYNILWFLRGTKPLASLNNLVDVGGLPIEDSFHMNFSARDCLCVDDDRNW